MKQGWIGGKTFTSEETIQLGSTLSEYIEPGDIIILKGDLASGKTTFVKGVMVGLHGTSEVTSPTFTLVNEYEADFKVIHMDCYREPDLDRWLKLGLHDYLYSNSVVLIEWPEIINELLPINIIEIQFNNINETEREVILK